MVKVVCKIINLSLPNLACFAPWLRVNSRTLEYFPSGYPASKPKRPLRQWHSQNRMEQEERAKRQGEGER